MIGDPLTNPETEGFAELVDLLIRDLEDLIPASEWDIPCLAVELADSVWKWRTKTPQPAAPEGGENAAPHDEGSTPSSGGLGLTCVWEEAWSDAADEMRHCDGCGEDYNAFAESHVGHEIPNLGREIPDHLWSPHCDEGCCQ